MHCSGVGRGLCCWPFRKIQPVSDVSVPVGYVPWPHEGELRVQQAEQLCAEVISGRRLLGVTVRINFLPDTPVVVDLDERVPGCKLAVSSAIKEAFAGRLKDAAFLPRATSELVCLELQTAPLQCT